MASNASSAGASLKEFDLTTADRAAALLISH
jgi:hypothetical protein